MINNALNMYSSKTDQIMSRFRPIAPKPQLTSNPFLHTQSTTGKTQESPFFKNLSTHIQPRPSRARKRGRSGISHATYKRVKTHLSGYSSLSQTTQLDLPLPDWVRLMSRGSNGSLEKTPNLFPFPLLPYSSFSDVAKSPQEAQSMNPATQFDNKVQDLKMVEKDLLQNLHAPFSGTMNSDLGCLNVIMPQPMRPIGSSISVGCIREDPSSNSTACISKKPEEVEAEVESDDLPAVVSDSNNKVRLANSAYKEMVGQPECLWLDLMTTHDGQLRGSACKRIGGAVMLDLSDSTMAVSSNGFSCRVRIDWARNGKKSSINAPCDVMRLSCESKDYLFTWRFHTR